MPVPYLLLLCAFFLYADRYTQARGVSGHRHGSLRGSLREAGDSSQLTAGEDHAHSQQEDSSTSSHDYFPLEHVDWISLQTRYAAKLDCYRLHNETLDLVIFGDSITESLWGTANGWPYEKAVDIPPVWEKHFGAWNALPLGIAGDRTMNLLWRMIEGGEADPLLSVKNAVIQIGTNNFYNHYMGLYDATPMSDTESLCEEIVGGILEAVRLLQNRWPMTQLYILGLLPRGDVDPSNLDAVSHLLPSMFTEPIMAINRRLASFAAQNDRVSLIDCSHALITAGVNLDPSLVADGIHPTALGMDRLLRCIKNHLPPLNHKEIERKVDSFR